MSTRWQLADSARGADYDARWAELSAAGQNIHGEADLVEALLTRYGGTRVLDAGCGTGRVAVELARRGLDVVGVDADPQMLEAARAKSPAAQWLQADLAALDPGAADGPFDLVLLAGNVMIFLAPGTEQRVIGALAERLRPGGLLVAGFSLRPDALSLQDYDRFAAAAGLRPLHRWATWDRVSVDETADPDYAVTVHRR